MHFVICIFCKCKFEGLRGLIAHMKKAHGHFAKKRQVMKRKGKGSGRVRKVRVVRPRAVAGENKEAKEKVESAPEAAVEKQQEKMANADQSEECHVCYCPLAEKRVVVNVPCMHKVHRTCAIHWLESRASATDQKCAVCRKDVDSIADIETGWELEPIVAYGSSGQPTRALIDNIVLYTAEETHSLRQHFEKSLELASKLNEDLRIARENGRGEGYVDDLQQEIVKLETRLQLLNDIETEFIRRRNRMHAAQQAALAALQPPQPPAPQPVLNPAAAPLPSAPGALHPLARPTAPSSSSSSNAGQSTTAQSNGHRAAPTAPRNAPQDRNSTNQPDNV